MNICGSKSKSVIWKGGMNELKALLYSMNNFKALDKKEPWKRGDINEKKDKGAASTEGGVL